MPGSEGLNVSVKEFYELKESVRLIEQSMKNREEIDKLRDEQLKRQLEEINTKLDDQAERYSALVNAPLERHQENSKTVRNWLITGGLTLLCGLIGVGIVQYMNSNVTKYDPQIQELQKVIEEQQKQLEELKKVN